MKKKLLAAVVVLAAAGGASATTFIVPDDAELVHKSKAIVTGVVISATAAEVEDGYVETSYVIAVNRVFKGPFLPRTRITVHSPGGITQSRYTYVESSAHFQAGDEVLLFLTPHRGGWTTTDLTLGKFRFALTSAGYGVVVRDAEDIVGWDRDGTVHQEIMRLEVEFLNFIQEVVAERIPSSRDYEVHADEVLAPPAPAASRMRPASELFPAPAHTYTISFHDCNLNRFPARWPTATMNAGIAWLKNSAQNASGRADGGVSVIQSALNAWTSDCESSVNLRYGGTTTNLKNSFDNVNVVVFNDPGDHIPGRWTGSGVIATCFNAGGADHDFGGVQYVSLTDGDVVFQDGYAGTEPSIEEAMTHELGHGIGFRHADRHYLKSCTTTPDCILTCNETACNSNVEECSGTAIMTASTDNTLNYTLQTWDKHAADAIYPGSCVVANPPANVVARATSTSVVNVTWTASAGAVSYNIYRSASGTSFTLAGSVSAPTVTFNDSGRTANTAYLYKVRAVNGGESTDSNIDLATTVIFTDDPLVAGATKVKAAHITQLRTAVNAVRTLASLGAGSYTDPTITAGVTKIKAVHVTQLRTALTAARAALPLPAISYAETITASTTKIKASHLTELRNGVK
ncbi:MAG TPA: M57 family metalloprotease [Thermoanaerobaculia bacterium]|nr:M57 family metalloprotease [Thermoanaerobaculia bacterium]